MNAGEANLSTEFEEPARFEALLVELSARFVNLPAERVDGEIENAQQRICEALGLDRSTLFQWQDLSQELAITHCWAKPEFQPNPLASANELYPWATRQLMAGQSIQYSSIEELPAEAVVDRESVRRLRPKSNVTFPLVVGGKVLGALAFGALVAERHWPESLVGHLRLLAEIVAGALARKQADLTLRQSADRLSLAAAAAGADLWEMHPPTGRFLTTDKGRELLGLGPDEDCDFQKFLSLIHADDREMVRQSLEQALQTGAGFQIEYRVPRRDGAFRWLSARGARQRAGPEGPSRLVGATVDVTERRQTVEALRRSNLEIAQLRDQLQAESDYLKAEIKVTLPHGKPVGQSDALKKVMRQAEQVAPTDSSVLLSGETGVGKERVAQAIHDLSPRKNRVMVKVNCAALPEALVESELFGREKGAFTGALTRQIGRFEVADHSTIFLDEIGELSLDIQAKLLRVLQAGEFERLGSPQTHRVNVRVIAATNRDLAEAIRQGRFREDLFYRLNVFPIRIPPLRERAQDIAPLVWAFLEEFSARMGKKITRIPRKTMEALQRYPWPGNVRELRNVLEHGVIISSSDTLKVPHLVQVAQSPRLPATLADSEREHILRVLQQTDWRIKGAHGAAGILGLKPSTLYGWMVKLGIPSHAQKAAPQ